MTHPKGNLFIIAAPSGGGKTSLVLALSERLPQLAISVSHTTRQRRPSEKEGESYYFVTPKVFSKMIQNDEFLEHATVFGHAYGTSKAEIDTRINAGVDVLLDIDWQGAAQIKKHYSDAMSIFIIPPSLSVLEARLENRKEDTKETVTSRMQAAQSEMSHFHEFDYLVCNDHFETALSDLSAIILANRLLCRRQKLYLEKRLSLLFQTK